MAKSGAFGLCKTAGREDQNRNQKPEEKFYHPPCYRAAPAIQFPGLGTMDNTL
jgi:hypothetical protein